MRRQYPSDPAAEETRGSRSPSPLRVAGPEPHPAPTVPPLYQVDVDAWIIGRGVVMPQAELVYEPAAEHPAWRVDARTVNAWADAYRHQLPRDRLQVTVWEEDPSMPTPFARSRGQTSAFPPQEPPYWYWMGCTHCSGCAKPSRRL